MAGIKDWGGGAVEYWEGSWVFGRRVLVLGVKWGGAGAYCDWEERSLLGVGVGAGAVSLSYLLLLGSSSGMQYTP